MVAGRATAPSAGRRRIRKGLSPICKLAAILAGSAKQGRGMSPDRYHPPDATVDALVFDVRTRGAEALRDPANVASLLELGRANGHAHGGNASRQVQKPVWPWRDHAVTLAQLQTMTFEPVSYLLPNIIPEGLTLLVGKPKIGKSWLSLDLGIAVSGNRYTLGNIKPAQGDVLYLALEDSNRRLQRRATKLLPIFEGTWPARMKVLTKWPIIGEGCLEAIEDWCGSVEKPTFIAIDTLQMIRPAIGKHLYEADCLALRGLQQLAGRWPNLSIITNHHDRKMGADDVFDTVAGTRGITGTADTVLVLARQSGAVTLHIDGRDVEKSELAIQFSKEVCRWTLLGAAAEVHRSAERARVLATLEGKPDGLSVAEIMAGANLRNQNSTYVLLFRMGADGEVENVRRGVYRASCKNGKKERSGTESPVPVEEMDNLTDLTDLTGGQGL
jgi:AAA domain-containing protein